MRRLPYVVLLVAVAMTVTCCRRKTDGAQVPDTVKDSLEFADDSTLYGLACEGCNDSAVWLLPPDASDPVPYDIVAAMRHHKVLGKIRTGDAIAIVVNPIDSTVADMVIDLDQLKGTWCYVEMPELGKAGNMPARDQKKMIEMLPDSIRETYYVPAEYGFTLKRNDAVTPLTLPKSLSGDEDNPFVYKENTKYTAWHILNGRMVLTKQVNEKIIMEDDSVGGEGSGEPPLRIEAKKVNDTVDIVLLYEDTLALKFKDRTQGYYRKK